MLTLSKSQRILNAAIRRAQRIGITICVAVCDRQGRLIAFNRMNDCDAWEADRSSMGKAVAAAVTGLPSERFLEHFQEHRIGSSSYNNVAPPRAQRGGLPVVEGGIVQGGFGVSGTAPAEQIEECAKAGIAVLDAAAEEQPRDQRPVFFEQSRDETVPVSGARTAEV